ncbi:hypothetical protein FW320_06625 [Azospirillum sp. Vi22]|uniref:carph-isopro domain-containing protein n=1 Tax=Azospirillum baldaniorum TaxID=1064539 RepID=UPI00157BA038|nr:hypothetical protein [Azospirillum baldaniorum]NUB05850.1 hypothetical protein [Azospirillum baldaniorum]
MSYAFNIIERLGGTRKVARMLGAAASTVQSWKECGEIPAPRQRELLRIAKREALPLQAEDFFKDDEEDRQSGDVGTTGQKDPT